MNATQLEKLIERYQKISDRNYHNYQETGTQRYYREYNNAEDIIDAARQALSAADEHQTLIAIKADFSQVIREGLMLAYGHGTTLQDVTEFLKSLETYKTLYRI